MSKACRTQESAFTLPSVSVLMRQETDSKRKGLSWILAGVGIELFGALLIWQSLPDFGVRTIPGLVCVVLGSLVMTWGLVKRAQRNQPRVEASPAITDWAPESELQTPTPRSVRLSPSGRRMVTWWFVMLSALPLYAYLVGQRGGPVRTDYADEYVEGVAVIHDKVKREGARGDGFYIYYNFESPEAPGRLRASASVTERQYSALKIGDLLRVWYLAPNPTVHELPDLEEKAPATPVVWFAVGFAGLLLLLFEVIRRRHKAITVFGVATPGNVEMLRPRWAGSVYTVTYRAEGQEKSLRGTERTRRLTEGDTLTVLYRADKPDHALIYRLGMYEARTADAEG